MAFFQFCATAVFCLSMNEATCTQQSKELFFWKNFTGMHRVLTWTQSNIFAMTCSKILSPIGVWPQYFSCWRMATKPCRQKHEKPLQQCTELMPMVLVWNLQLWQTGVMFGCPHTFHLLCLFALKQSDRYSLESIQTPSLSTAFYMNFKTCACQVTLTA